VVGECAAALDTVGVHMNGDYDLRHPGRREAAVAIAVAVLLVAVSWLAARGPDDPAKGDLTSLASQSDDSIIRLDQSGDVTPSQVRQCIDATFASSADSVDTLYAVQQLSQAGKTPVLVLRNDAGELRLCDSFGGDAPSVAPVQLAGARRAVRLLSNGRQAFDCDGTRLSGLAVSHWLSVNDSVDRAEIRFLIDGVNSPWFSAKAKGGFVHVHGWIDEQSAGAQVSVQTRVLDAAGAAVPQKALPTEPQPVTSCTGGDVQLG
jgi:hypothetical protein